MSDKFSNDPDDAKAPSRLPYEVVPSDTVALPVLPKALRVGNGGTLVLRGVDSEFDVTLLNVASGETFDIRASHVRSTGTTCTGIVALA